MTGDGGERRPFSRKDIVLRRGGLLTWAAATAVLTAVFLAALLALSSRFPMSWDWFVPLSLLAGALLALVILWKGPQWQTAQVKGLNRKERFDRENDARKTLATILGGLVLLGGGYATWRNIKLAQESLKVSQQSSATSQKALSVAQEGQITDRFTKAIEQLGASDATGKNKKREVRLGGVYSLEAIANESRSFHWPIMEVLCTYVRENAPSTQRKSAEKKQESAKNRLGEAREGHPAADIQAILTVLGRRDRRSERDNQLLDLSEVKLIGANLSKANLRSANLSGADLTDAYLDGADLSGATLAEARLDWAQLDLANLSGADLTDAYLDGAFLDGADLSKANFSGAILSEAKLRGADLSGANLTGAALNGADLSSTKNLTQAQIDAAEEGDSITKLPKGLLMPDSWKKK